MSSTDLPRYELLADGGRPKYFDTQEDALSYARSNYYETFDIVDTHTDRQVYQEFPRFEWA